MNMQSTIQSTVNWYGADSTVHLPMPGRSLLAVIKTRTATYIETDVHFWREQGIWVDPSGDPVEGAVILWAYLQSIVPGIAK